MEIGHEQVIDGVFYREITPETMRAYIYRPSWPSPEVVASACYEWNRACQRIYGEHGINVVYGPMFTGKTATASKIAHWNRGQFLAVQLSAGIREDFQNGRIVSKAAAPFNGETIHNTYQSVYGYAKRMTANTRQYEVLVVDEGQMIDIEEESPEESIEYAEKTVIECGVSLVITGVDRVYTGQSFGPMFPMIEKTRDKGGLWEGHKLYTDCRGCNKPNAQFTARLARDESTGLFVPADYHGRTFLASDNYLPVCNSWDGTNSQSFAPAPRCASALNFPEGYFPPLDPTPPEKIVMYSF